MTRYEQFVKALNRASKGYVEVAYYFAHLDDDDKKKARAHLLSEGYEKSLASRLLSCGSLLTKSTNGIECIYPVESLTFGLLKEMTGKDSTALQAFFDTYGSVKGISDFRTKWQEFTAPEEAPEEAPEVVAPFTIELCKNGVIDIITEVTEDQYNKILAIIGEEC